MKYILFLLVILAASCSSKKAQPKSEIMPLAALATLPTVETSYAANGDTIVWTQTRKTFVYDTWIKTVKPFKGTTTTQSPPTTTTRQNITFDPGTDISKWPVKGTSTSYGITNATIGGKSAYRFEVRKGDPVFAGGVRAELNLYGDTKSTYPYEVWYGLSYYVPGDWINDQPNLFDIVHQWHDEGGSLKSPFDFSINGSKWRYQVRSNDISGIEKGIDFSTVEKDTWTDFVIHLKFVKSGTGLVEIWKNGTKVVTDATPMGWSSATIPPFFKMGIYKWPWNPQDLACCGNTNSRQHTIYISNFRLGNSLATFNDVKP